MSCSASEGFGEELLLRVEDNRSTEPRVLHHGVIVDATSPCRSLTSKESAQETLKHSLPASSKLRSLE